jgi:DNA-binding MarR family transcriptional regulator
MEDKRILLQRALMRTSGKLAKVSKANLEQYNLSGAEYGILRNLGDGALTLSEISQRSLRVNSNTTAMVDGLESKGLVERVRDEADRRIIRVRLTAAGVRLRDEVVPRQNSFIREFLSGIDDADINQLLNLLQKVEAICERE